MLLPATLLPGRACCSYVISNAQLACAEGGGVLVGWPMWTLLIQPSCVSCRAQDSFQPNMSERLQQKSEPRCLVSLLSEAVLCLLLRSSVWSVWPSTEQHSSTSAMVYCFMHKCEVLTVKAMQCQAESDRSCLAAASTPSLFPREAFMPN